MGLAQAARECGISVSTLRRRKEALLAAGATVSEKGWQIPIPALVSIGLLGSTTPPPDTRPNAALQPATVPPPEGPRDTVLLELNSLRARLAEAERRAAVAEAIATERERIIQAQAATLRMLEPSTPAPIADEPPGTLAPATDGMPVSGPVPPPVGRARRLLSFVRSL